MLTFLFSQLALYAAIILVLVIPGYFLIKATGINKLFSNLELAVLTFAASISVMDFLIILLGKFGHITKTSVLSVIITFGLICIGFAYFKQKNQPKATTNQSSLSKRSTILVILLMFLTIFIKTIYFKDAIFPTATDLGHHMYWTKTITETGKLPIYAKADITQDLSIGQPQPIADFIIGEHLIFAAIALISGADFISAFPALILFLINVITALAIFLLARELFKKAERRDTIALLALFLAGPLYALASPQAKFASGGVIGNTIGNLFIPVLILLYLRALSEKSAKLLAFALFISLGLAYTHHLSTFVFVFLSFFSLISYAILNRQTLSQEARQWLSLILTPPVLAVLAMGAVFVFLIYTPTYLNTHAIDTAVGAPSKSTRSGLTLTQLKTTAGEARFAFALVGLMLLFLAKKLGKYNQAFLIGWTFALTLMSLKPDLLLIDIPSNRIASYIVFPSAMVAAYMFVRVFTALRSNQKEENYLSPAFIVVVFLAFISFTSTNGFADDAAALNLNSSASRAIMTYNASNYLASKTAATDIILKDHNYLAGDSWIKLAFMRGYNYPLSRGFFKRYQDATKNREQCTNFMISQPSGSEAKQCFAGTGTDFIMLNPKMDSAQFHRLPEFWQVYSSDEVGIFYKAQ